MGSGPCSMFHVDREVECFSISSWLADARFRARGIWHSLVRKKEFDSSQSPLPP